VTFNMTGLGVQNRAPVQTTAASLGAHDTTPRRNLAQAMLARSARILQAMSLFIGLLFPHATLAQPIYPPGTLMLSGYRATCGLVRTQVLEIADISQAWNGLIILSPRVFTLPKSQQLFWYTHECAHHIFGSNEAVADCWSVEQGRVQGWLDRAEFEALEAKIHRLPGDASHARGPERAAYLRSCYYR